MYTKIYSTNPKVIELEEQPENQKAVIQALAQEDEEQLLCVYVDPT
jgi:hypothetical protein